MTLSLLPEHERPDWHSFSNPHQLRVTHLSWKVLIDFEEERLYGLATLLFERQPGCPLDAPLILDTRGLEILNVWAGWGVHSEYGADFLLGETHAILGAPLMVALPENATQVTISYRTTEGSDALQWLPPTRVGGSKFVFSQCEAILARSLVPLQDSPGVRITYDASVYVEPGVTAVMAADAAPSNSVNVFNFKMEQTIPSYLIALAAGELAFRPLGPRTGVYADPAVIEAAAWEFAEAEIFLAAAEELCGPYRWGRWDMLVLPANFPFGGMENPKLTFVTPTVLAGDRSLVALILHELAHSWSGNLVTNANWSAFYLNEGWTTYLQTRLLEMVYGQERADMELVLGEEDLREILAVAQEIDQVLHVYLVGRDPDLAMTDLAYEKGALFIRELERAVGRAIFDAYMRAYFECFAFQSITTEQFKAHLQEHLPQAFEVVDVDTWLHQPGLPAHTPALSARLAAVEEAASSWLRGDVTASALDVLSWSTHEWLRFLTRMPTLEVSQMAELDACFHLTENPNDEIAHQWLLMAVKNEYHHADATIASYVGHIGRRKLVLPLYKAMVATVEGRTTAAALYQQNRSFYHSILRRSIELVLEQGDQASVSTRH